MASILSHHFPLLVFLLSLSNSIVTAKSSSWSPDRRETNFQKWVSWNVRKHRDKCNIMMFGPESTTSTTQAPPASAGVKVVDDKLRNAEMNKVRISVCQNGTGNFKTITEALNSIKPPYNTRRVILKIKPGVYREKIIVPRRLPFITFLGNPSDPPIITGNDTASVAGKDGRPLKTYQSATVAVDANYFVAINMKFENTAPHEIGSIGEQPLHFVFQEPKLHSTTAVSMGAKTLFMITKASTTSTIASSKVLLTSFSAMASHYMRWVQKT
ncbi:hypothetical protein Ddye_017226 [Dipteronia dyeriana]|uniref:pectinesterase n=1 Tax=Dipteronia dyeriana TaxID=168575 RepID=A0AAD9U942_9ROSI|nr:hypothetical protein Ddye_017226 [Dipteronia dyeriana]